MLFVKLKSRRRALKALSSAALAPLIAPISSFAQAAYPQRPVKIIVPFAPAGPSDLVGRLVATLLQSRMGNSFVVENRAGAGGNIGTSVAGKAAADGYTLLVTGSSQFTVNPWLFKDVSFDFQRDFAPIAEVAVAPAVFATHPKTGIKTIQELVKYARANPGKLNVGNSSAGSPPHLAAEQLVADAGLQVVHVPYSGAGPAVQALLGQSIDVTSTAVPPVQALIESGRLTGLAVTGSSRWPRLPNVPTMIESGFPDFVIESVFALFAPAGTPSEIIHRLAKETAAALNDNDARERALGTGFEARYAGAEELRARILKEAPRFKTLIEKARIPLQ
jgi:tripartite-type tricarboxylate transporter receptor subunit TctC